MKYAVIVATCAISADALRADDLAQGLRVAAAAPEDALAAEAHQEEPTEAAPLLGDATAAAAPAEAPLPLGEAAPLVEPAFVASVKTLVEEKHSIHYDDNENILSGKF